MVFAEINDHIIHYKWIHSGRVKTFVFLNSLGTDIRIWDVVVQNLEDAGNILLADKRGHGQSEVVDGTGSLKEYGQDTVALMDFLEIESAVIVGLSVGGMIAIELTQLIPERIEKLILCDTRYQIGSVEGWNQRIDTVQKNGIMEISSSMMEIWFSKRFRESNKEEVRKYQTMLESMPVEGYVQACQAIRDADLTKACKKITIPTLCLAGSEDPSTSPGDVKDLACLISGSRFEVIEDSAHIPCVDNPDALTQLIREFVFDN